MKTGIVILNYNDATTTRNLVKNIEKYESLNYILVVDNYSQDNSYDKLCKLKSEKVHVIKSDKNGGYSYGNNYGIKYIINNLGVDIIFVANPDIVFDEWVVLEILRKFETTDYSMLSGVMLNPNGTVIEGTPVKIPSFIDDIISCYMILSYIKRKINPLKIDYLKGTIVNVELLPGSFFAIQASCFEAVGQFDEEIFLYCEERILGRKLVEKGYKIGLITNVKYFHFHGTSINKVYKSIQARKILLGSKLHYQVKYNNINCIKRFILKVCMNYSILEFRAYLILKKSFKL